MAHNGPDHQPLGRRATCSRACRFSPIETLDIDPLGPCRTWGSRRSRLASAWQPAATDRGLPLVHGLFRSGSPRPLHSARSARRRTSGSRPSTWPRRAPARPAPWRSSTGCACPRDRATPTSIGAVGRRGSAGGAVPGAQPGLHLLHLAGLGGADSPGDVLGAGRRCDPLPGREQPDGLLEPLPRHHDVCTGSAHAHPGRRRRVGPCQHLRNSPSRHLPPLMPELDVNGEDLHSPASRTTFSGPEHCSWQVQTSMGQRIEREGERVSRVSCSFTRELVAWCACTVVAGRDRRSRRGVRELP
jgi:hypothetical protein